MIFQKQVQFSKYIKTINGLKEFNFLKLTKVEFPTYQVDVGDDRGRRYEFTMINEGEDWKMHGKDLPGWLQSAEHAILDAIKEEELEIRL